MLSYSTLFGYLPLFQNYWYRPAPLPLTSLQNQQGDRSISHVVQYLRVPSESHLMAQNAMFEATLQGTSGSTLSQEASGVSPGGPRLRKLGPSLGTPSEPTTTQWIETSQLAPPPRFFLSVFNSSTFINTVESTCCPKTGNSWPSGLSSLQKKYASHRLRDPLIVGRKRA